MVVGSERFRSSCVVIVALFEETGGESTGGFSGNGVSAHYKRDKPGRLGICKSICN